MEMVENVDPYVVHGAVTRPFHEMARVTEVSVRGNSTVSVVSGLEHLAKVNALIIS